jgi:hypothetical protein
VNGTGRRDGGRRGSYDAVVAVTAVVSDDSFDITLTGWDRLWALRRRLSIPISQITGARVVPRDVAVRRLRWRIGGTHVPGLVRAGRYSLRSGDGRAFASVYRDAEVLEVTTRSADPRLVVLQHPDRHDLAWYLGERLT